MSAEDKRTKRTNFSRLARRTRLPYAKGILIHPMAEPLITRGTSKRVNQLGAVLVRPKHEVQMNTIRLARVPCVAQQATAKDLELVRDRNASFLHVAINANHPIGVQDADVITETATASPVRR